MSSAAEELLFSCRETMLRVFASALEVLTKHVYLGLVHPTRNLGPR